MHVFLMTVFYPEQCFYQSPIKIITLITMNLNLFEYLLYTTKKMKMLFSLFSKKNSQEMTQYGVGKCLFDRYYKKTVRELKADINYKNIDGRSKLKTKKEICQAIVNEICNYKGGTQYGIFTGNRNLDSIVLLYLSDQDLFNLCCTNTYFLGFIKYNALWKRKVVFQIGDQYLPDYECEEWKCFYLRLVHRILRISIPKNIFGHKK